MTVNWQGVYPRVTTQYNDDLSINFETTQKIAHHFFSYVLSFLTYINSNELTKI